MTLEEALAQLPTPPRTLKPLAPSFLDPAEWRPRGAMRGDTRPAGWSGLRARILARDGGCVYCGHTSGTGPRDRLEVNHLNGYRDNRPEAMETVCVLCHRVLHAGRSAAIHGSLLLFAHALPGVVSREGEGTAQNTLIRLSWHLRLAVRMPDRPLMALLGLSGPSPFRMDRVYLAGLFGYVVEQYWLLERPAYGAR